jgi:BirA family biotin operon repressor/biotin-[acetyl-CoA-carboxylase] ligase
VTFILKAPHTYSVQHLASVGSTNDAAMVALTQGDDRLWIVADEQTGGRGRLGRTWVSAPGNLYATLALRSPCDMAAAYQLGVVTAVALCEALVSLGLPQEAVALKWPNDALVNGAKIAGILIEGTSLADGGFGVVIGCGINCAHHPANMPYPATDLSSLGFSISVAEVFSAFAQALENELQRFDSGVGFPMVRSRWLARARGLGTSITVRRGDEVLEGVFTGLDRDGQLLLERDGEVIRIVAGDVLFRPD